MGIRTLVHWMRGHLWILFYYGLTFLLCLLLVIGETESDAFFTAALLLFVLAIAWVVQLLRIVISKSRFAWKTIAQRLALPPLLIVLLLVLDSTGITFKVLWRLSLSQMNNLAGEVSAAPDNAHFAPRQVGFFDASDIEKIPGGVRFRSGYGHPFDWNGFAYSPRATPSSESHTNTASKFEYKPIGDGWYKCYGF